LRRQRRATSTSRSGLPKRPKTKREPAAVHQLKITLLDTDPPIWRRVLVRSGTTLAELHRVIQVAMGWEGYHLHSFGVVGWGAYDDLDDDREATTLWRIAPRPGDGLGYRYDFGDDWDHEVLVEKVLVAGRRHAYPVCLAGRRACPPEDSGGPWGSVRFLKAMARRRGPEYREYRESYRTKWDAAAFDLDEVNAALRGR
jgi:pRiA4b ORF-3-like protein